MTEPIVVTESLGGSALSRAARAGELSQWYRAVPRGNEWRSHAAEVRQSVAADWYDKLAPAFGARGAAADRLQRSAGSNGIVITTGQQPGLFGGPLMSLIKALSARALADVLQDTLGIPVAPVFWAATDDADFDEAAAVSVSLDGGARELRLEHRAPPGTPMTRVPLDDDEIDSLAVWLREASGSASHAEYLDAALRAYHGRPTVGDAYVTLLRDVLEPLEIAVLDASHASLTRAAAPLMGRAAAMAQDLAAAVHERGRDIVAAGFSPQVEEVAGLSLVSAIERGTKRRLPIGEAMALGEDRSDRFLTSTVLLRPVLERTMLPTAAYLGGPGEVAYFAQVTAVATALGVPVPLVLPRWSATIIEPRVQRLLSELGAEPHDLADAHALDGRVARAHMPADATRAIAKLRADLASDIDALARDNDGLVPNAVLDGLRRSLEHRVERLERRFVAAVKRRETDVMRKVATARGSLYPHGVRQERKLAYIPFLARYGPALVEQMLSAARAHARLLVSGAPAMAAAAPSTPARV